MAWSDVAAEQGAVTALLGWLELDVIQIDMS